MHSTDISLSIGFWLFPVVLSRDKETIAWHFSSLLDDVEVKFW